MAEEHSDAERNVRQHALRKTVATASLQIVLLSKALLNHVGLHANDPLGTILHHKRVLGLFLGVNESKDIMPLHRSGNLFDDGSFRAKYSHRFFFVFFSSMFLWFLAKNHHDGSRYEICYRVWKEGARNSRPFSASCPRRSESPTGPFQNHTQETAIGNPFHISYAVIGPKDRDLNLNGQNGAVKWAFEMNHAIYSRVKLFSSPSIDGCNMNLPGRFTLLSIIPILSVARLEIFPIDRMWEIVTRDFLLENIFFFYLLFVLLCSS